MAAPGLLKNNILLAQGPFAVTRQQRQRNQHSEYLAEDPAFAGTFAVDFVVQPHTDTDATLPPRTIDFSDEELEMIGTKDERPMLLTLHGLTGGSQEAYLRHVLESLFQEGWEACVINARGCAQSKITSDFLFNARATWDVRQVVKWLRQTFPNRPLFAIGYSLGANILVNYLGEEGDKCLLDAAVVCSNPWNLELGNAALQRTWAGLEGYSKSMARDLKGLFELLISSTAPLASVIADICRSHIEQLSRHPRIDIDRVRSVRYLHEFDRLTTILESYKGQHGAIPLREHIVRPAALQAKIAAHEAIPYQEFQQNPFAVMCVTKLGGHLGWFESGGGRWFAKTVSRPYIGRVYE
ncbi:MAG: hypothetical protein Q9196_001768 [Gyalolechia fulgens]